MSEEHPARRAGLLSQRHVANGDREAWLALFADDGVVQDPVGPSPLDPATSSKSDQLSAAIVFFSSPRMASPKVGYHSTYANPASTAHCCRAPLCLSALPRWMSSSGSRATAV
jgi:hypothetical protein